MMDKNNLILFISILLMTACAPASSPTSQSVLVTGTFSPISSPKGTATITSLSPIPTQKETETFTPTLRALTETGTPTPIPFVDSLEATVTADLLSCRYGPGPEYLYLFAFKKGANIILIGRTEGNNWLLVENEPQRCWIHANFVETQGDRQLLKPMYPDGFQLIVSPYYGPTSVLSAERKGDEITVTWLEVRVSPGKYEDENMFPYIIEVWRCENGEIIFDPLVSRSPIITFVDQAGCDSPSHGRVYVQEKHGYAGPADIPWPSP